MLQRSYIPNTGVKSWKNLVLDDDAPTAVTAQPNAKEDQKAQAAHLKLMRQTASAALAAAAQAVKASKAAYKLQDQTSPESKTPSQQGPRCPPFTPDQPTKKTKRAKTAPKEMQQSDEHAKHNSQASPISSETIKHTGDEHQGPEETEPSADTKQQAKRPAAKLQAKSKCRPSPKKSTKASKAKAKAKANTQVTSSTGPRSKVTEDALVIQPDSVTPSSTKVRAARGTAGTFAGRRPPTDPIKLQIFLDMKEDYYRWLAEARASKHANTKPSQPDRNFTGQQHDYWNFMQKKMTALAAEGVAGGERMKLAAQAWKAEGKGKKEKE